MPQARYLTTDWPQLTTIVTEERREHHYIDYCAHLMVPNPSTLQPFVLPRTLYSISILVSSPVQIADPLFVKNHISNPTKKNQYAEDSI